MFVSLTEWGKLSTNFTIMHVHDILLVVASSGKMLIHKFRKQRMVCAGNKTIKQRDRCPIENKISWTMAHVHTENQYRYICTIRPKYYITQLYTINSWQRTLCLVMTPDLAAWRNPMYVANWLPLWECRGACRSLLAFFLLGPSYTCIYIYTDFWCGHEPLFNLSFYIQLGNDFFVW